MVIIYGHKSYIKYDKALGVSPCPNCTYPTQQSLGREKTRFHICYIPVFVKNGKRGIICPNCGMAKALSKQEYKEMLGK